MDACRRFRMMRAHVVLETERVADISGLHGGSLYKFVFRANRGVTCSLTPVRCGRSFSYGNRAAYSLLVRLSIRYASSFTDRTTSHSTKPASGQVAGYARLLALHPAKQISRGPTMPRQQILVVDDEIGIRELLSEILFDEGYQVYLAKNAEQARAYRNEREPDLVLLDIWMPDTDGITS